MTLRLNQAQAGAALQAYHLVDTARRHARNLGHPTGAQKIDLFTPTATNQADIAAGPVVQGKVCVQFDPDQPVTSHYDPATLRSSIDRETSGQATVHLEVSNVRSFNTMFSPSTHTRYTYTSQKEHLHSRTGLKSQTVDITSGGQWTVQNYFLGFKQGPAMVMPDFDSDWTRRAMFADTTISTPMPIVGAG